MGAAKFFLLTLLVFSALPINESTASTQKHIAVIFGKYIYLADINPTAEELKEIRISYPQLSREALLHQAQAHKLTALIWTPIIEKFAQQHDVEPTIDEIQNVAKYMESKIPGDLAPRSLESNNEAVNKTYHSMVRTWKLSKALYKEFGGIVTFQQANPLEPTGAYRKLLEKHEQEGSFQIYNMELRKTLFAPFVRQPLYVMPENEVDYSVPWWQQEGKK